MNTWLSNFIIEQLRTDHIPDAKVIHDFMGTLNSSYQPLPKLFYPKIIDIHLDLDYTQEVFSNDVFIYSLEGANLEEAEFLIRGLKITKYDTKKTLILISSIMTWGKTPPNIKNSEETLNEYFEPENQPDEYEENDGADEFDFSVMNNLIPEKPVEDKKKPNKLEQKKLNNQSIVSTVILPPKEYYYTEKDYAKRVPHKKYFRFNYLENLAMSNTNPCLKVYIVCPGFIYGCGENFFFDYCRMSYFGVPPVIPIIGNGLNTIPTIHIIDLVNIIRILVEKNPIVTYILAIDKTKNRALKNILKAIGKGFGNRKVRMLNFFNVDEVNVPNYAELAVNIKLKPSKFLLDEKKKEESEEEYNKRKFKWHSEFGIPENIDMIKDEFILYRGLTKTKIIVIGPPSSGKTTLCKELAAKYNLSLLNLKDIVNWSKTSLKNELGKEIREREEKLNEEMAEAEEAYAKRKNKKKTDPPFDPEQYKRFPDELLYRVIRERIKQNDCNSNGYIFDDFPKRYQECVDYFCKEIKTVREVEEEEKDGTKTIKQEEVVEKVIEKDLLPDLVFNVVISEDKIKERLEKLPDFEENGDVIIGDFEERMKKYTEMNTIPEKIKQGTEPIKTIMMFFEENNMEVFNYDFALMEENKEEFDEKLNEYLKKGGALNNIIRLNDIDEKIKINVDEFIKQEESEMGKVQMDSKTPVDPDDEIEDEKKKELYKESREFEEGIKSRLREMNSNEKSILQNQSEVFRWFINEKLIPVLYKGILEISKTQPEDPVDELCEYIFEDLDNKKKEKEKKIEEENEKEIEKDFEDEKEIVVEKEPEIEKKTSQ